MKKLLYLLSVAALIWSCDKVDEIDLPILDEPVVEEEKVPASKLPEVLYAYTSGDEEDSQTRTYVEDKKVLWNNGDEIFYCAGNIIGAEYKFEGEDGAAKATFNKVNDGTVQNNQVPFSLGVYPYNQRISATCNNDNTWTVIPLYQQHQTYVPNSFGKDANIMIAAGKDATDDNLYFRNACGYLVIKLYGKNVKVTEISVTANDESVRLVGKKFAINVNSDGVLDFNQNEIASEVSNQESNTNSVTLDCGTEGVKIGEDSAHATEFWFALPPMTITGGITVRVKDTYENVITKETTKDIVIPLNKVQPMAAFDVTNKAKVTKLWYTTTNNEQLLNRFNSEKDTYEYFDAKISKLNVVENNKYTGNKPMYCIEFDQPLTEIKKDAFKETEITEIILPEALTTIGANAFNETKLTTLTIPGNVTCIKENAFSNCTNLTNVTFSQNNSGTPLTIDTPNQSYSGDNNLFYGSNNIHTLYLYREFEAADEQEYMGLFENHTNLTNITIGDQVETIHHHMFYKAGTSINQITIPSSVKLIETGAFRECKVSEIVITDSSDKTTPRTIGGSAFQDCTTLTSITIPEGVTTIGACAFFNCSNLTAITIPGTVTEIGERAFNGCTSLKNVAFNPGSTPLTIDAIYIDNAAIWESEVGPFYYSPLTSIYLDRNIVLAEKYKNILDQEDEGIFSCQVYKNNEHQTTLEIGDNVTKILPYMFAGSAITSITIPANVTEIGNYAFCECTKLSTVTFDDSKQTLHIGYQPSSTDDVGPFWQSPLTSIHLNRDIVMTDSYAGGLNEANEGIFSYKGYNNDGHQTTLEIGNNVTKILPYMFASSAITSIKIPANVTEIGNYAFYECPRLSNVTIGENVEIIQPYTFANSAITSITIPAKVTEIGYNAFLYCGKLSEVNIPESSTPLTLGYQYSSSAEWGPFYDSPLAKVTLKRDINYVKKTSTDPFTPDQWDEGVFANKHNELTTIDLDANLTKILPYMFSGTEATNVWIPHTVTSIGNYAFSECENLLGVTMGYDGTTDFPSIGTYVFESCEKFYYIKVRKRQLEKFQKSTQWDTYEEMLKEKNNYGFSTSDDFQ